MKDEREKLHNEGFKRVKFNYIPDKLMSLHRLEEYDHFEGVNILVEILRNTRQHVPSIHILPPTLIMVGLPFLIRYI